MCEWMPATEGILCDIVIVIISMLYGELNYILTDLSIYRSLLRLVDEEAVHRVPAHIVHDGVVQPVGLFSVGLHDIL